MRKENQTRRNSDMKHKQFCDNFLKEEVNLNPSRLDRLNSSVKAVSEYLSQNLSSYVKVERQGSYALKTIIRPAKDGQEYDADLLLYMKYDGDQKPKDYIDDLYRCLADNKIYSEKARRNTRCVTLDYAGDFHLDIVPCIKGRDGEQYICNKETNEFEPTDGTGYRDWFNDRTRITHGNLKRVTRLLKYMRDHKGNFTAKSILLTTLIGKAVINEDDSENFKSIPDALKTVMNRINDFLQEKPEIPNIVNPVMRDEDFTRHWDQKKYAHFRSLFNTYTHKVNEACDSKDHDDSIEKWRSLFGDGFGKKREGGDSTSSRSGVTTGGAIITVTPRKPYAR